MQTTMADAENVLSMVGNGKALCIAFDGKSAACIAPEFWGGERVDVSPVLARSVVANNKHLLCMAVREDIRQKSGWKSLGLPGGTHEVWSFTQ